MSENGNTYKKALSARIAAGINECVRRGMSRPGIAKAMGYETAASLSKWANDNATPEAENLAGLAVATGLSLDWLVAGRGPMFPPEHTDATRLDIIGTLSDRGVELDAEKAEAIRALLTPSASDHPEETTGERALEADTAASGQHSSEGGPAPQGPGGVRKAE